MPKFISFKPRHDSISRSSKSHQYLMIYLYIRVYICVCVSNWSQGCHIIRFDALDDAKKSIKNFDRMPTSYASTEKCNFLTRMWMRFSGASLYLNFFRTLISYIYIYRCKVYTELINDSVIIIWYQCEKVHGRTFNGVYTRYEYIIICTLILYFKIILSILHKTQWQSLVMNRQNRIGEMEFGEKMNTSISP